MAFNSLFRRVSTSILPLQIRRQFLPICGFSTTIHAHAANKLLSVVESGYNTQPSFDMNFPEEFPYGIEIVENQHSIFSEHMKYFLRRRYQDEIIEVGFDGYELVDDTPQMPLDAHVLRGVQHLHFEMLAQPDGIYIKTCTIENTIDRHLNAFNKFLEIRGFNSSMIISLVHFQQSSNVPDGFPFKIDVQHKKGDLFLVRELEDESIQIEVSGLSYCVSGVENPETSFEMSVKVVRYRVEINFEISVFPHHPDQIRIDEVSIRERCGHLDAFQNFWEIRGVKPSTANFLFRHFNKRAEQRFHRWPGVKLSPQTPTYNSGNQQI